MGDKLSEKRGFIRSLNFRLVLFVSVFLLAAIGLFSYMMTRIEHDELIGEVVNGSRRFSEGVKRSTRYAMLKFDREAMHQILEQVGQQENVERVRIFNKEGDVIISTHLEEIGHRVDKQAEACYGCHEVDKPLEKLPMSRRWRIFDQPGERRVGIVDPIFNEPDCWNAPCHAHPENKKVLGVLDVVVSLKEVDEMLTASAWRRAIFTIATIILVGAVIGYYTYRTVSVPVHRLAKGTKRVASGDLDYRIPVTGATEIAYLAESFNKMGSELKETYDKLQGKVDAADENLKRVNEELRQANKELIERQEQLIRSEKLASIGKLAAGVAHEINNPLTGVLTFSHLLLDDAGKDDPRREDLEVIIKETERCRDIVKGLLDYSRQTEPQKISMRINEVIDKTLSLLEHQAAFRNIKIIREYHDDLPYIMIDKDKIQQVLINLLTNAQEAMPEGGSVTITATRMADEKSVEMKFADTGCGIPKDEILKLFDPFYSTKELGTGLGLSITQGIITSHKGTIEVQSEVGTGTTFIIRLPVG